jgi:hypothetical protein
MYQASIPFDTPSSHESEAFSTEPDQSLYTPKQVALIFMRDPRTIRRWSEEGRLPKVKIGKATFYRGSDIELLINGPDDPRLLASEG